MILSKLYSNQPSKFVDINFNDSLNVVLAEIRLPENHKKDTHNLGKTTIGKMLDFCFLSKKDSNFFLFKHKDTFKDFIFFLELKAFNGEYLTIKRSVKEANKISFKKSLNSNQNFSHLSEQDWDYAQIKFADAKKILDGLLNISAFNSLNNVFDFRKGLAYLLRSPFDYTDVFKLKKFLGKDSDWKPFLAHILGFNTELINQHYDKEREINDKKLRIKSIENEYSTSTKDYAKIEAILSIKQESIINKQKLLDSFDFDSTDESIIKEVIDEIDISIANLNSKRYSLELNRKKILLAIEENKPSFDCNTAEQLFKEVGVLFEGQIKKDFEQLITFNKEITEERCKYLRGDLKEIDASIKETKSDLNRLGNDRSNKLAFISNTDVIAKYKQLTDELVTLKSDIHLLIKQRESIERLKKIRAEIDILKENKTHLKNKIDENISKEQVSENNDSLFSKIRSYFSEIIEEVIDERAILSVSVNKEGHLDFKAEILDKLGNSTSADKGTSYKKLLCIAFDMAILRANSDKNFPKFVFHDAVLEGLDDRKKQNLIKVMRNYSNFGIQQIVTLIDSDLPKMPQNEFADNNFHPEEIILHLHDQDYSGRLFKMNFW